MMLYADDSVMVCGDSDIRRLKCKTETEFSKIKEWTKINKISLNYNKTKCTVCYSHKASRSLQTLLSTRHSLMVR